VFLRAGDSFTFYEIDATVQRWRAIRNISAIVTEMRAECADQARRRAPDPRRSADKYDLMILDASHPMRSRSI